MRILHIACLVVGVTFSYTQAVFAAGGSGKVIDVDFGFEGPFGTFDQARLQRGFQVYQEVCAACHSLKYVAFRNLTDEAGPRFSEEQAKAIASLYEVIDTDGEPGDTRQAKLFDKFPLVAAEGNPPDLSLITKARSAFHDGFGASQLRRGMGGPEYIYSFLQGFSGEEKEEAGAYLYSNSAFPGGWVAMAPPLEEGLVEYTDGTEATSEQMARDVTEFLTWAAEPKLHERKSAGMRNFVFMALFAILLYYSNRRLWKEIKGKNK